MKTPDAPALVGPPFLNDGGPLLVLPHDLIGDWTGTPTDDPVGGDNARACNCENEAELLAVGTGHGFAVGVTEGVAQACWATDGDRWYVVASLYGDDEADVELLRQLSGDAVQWSEPVGVLEARGGLVLLHAASPGSQIEQVAPEGRVTAWATSEVVGIGDAVHATVPDGSWCVDHAYSEVRIEPDGGGAWVVARLTRAD